MERGAKYNFHRISNFSTFFKYLSVVLWLNTVVKMEEKIMTRSFFIK